MKITDITRPLENSMLVYPGDIVSSFRQADQGRYLISDLHMSSHTGTHIDAPAHYLKSGDTIDTIPLSSLIGRCRVVDVRDAGNLITAEDLGGKPLDAPRILLKTEYSGRKTFAENYPSLSLDAASMIMDRGIGCIGIDSPSIEIFGCDGSVHRRLLSGGCVIIELLDLSGVAEGVYQMVALPLRLAGLDGAPARVVLIEEDGE